MSASDPDREIARALRLRGERPPVARVSRRALVLLAGAGSLALAGVVGWSMRPHSPARGAEAETRTVAETPPPAAITELPKDYRSLPPSAPKLGPPLPGDLGRPLLEASDSAPKGTSDGSVRMADPSAEQARAARSSQLSAPTVARTAPPPAAVSGGATISRETKVDVGAQGASPTASRLEAPSSPYTLQAGSVIRAALLTGIRSDLPGQVTAQVTEDVFDSAGGRWKLIPQGSRLIGAYESHVSFGQERLQLAWTRLILPDGRSIALEKAVAADRSGYAGLEDQVDRHWRRLGGAALVSSLLAAGAQLGAGSSDSQILQALRSGGASAMSIAGQQLVGKVMDAQPTLTIRPGYAFNVMVAHDLVLEPVR